MTRQPPPVPPLPPPNPVLRHEVYVGMRPGCALALLLWIVRR